MITEDYVSFETAKLLKEKGFDVWGDGSFGTVTKIWKEYSPSGILNDCSTSSPSRKAFPAPTLQMAMKWLREVYGIYPDIAVKEIDNNIILFRVDGIYLKQKKMWDKYNNLFKTYEEACEAAIKYCLENLI